MKWLRYLLVAAFTLFAPVANAGLDPIGWSLSPTLPAETIVDESYPGFTYTFVSNLPFVMPTPLFIDKIIEGEFVLLADNCTGLKLVPHQQCTVVFAGFTPLTPGEKVLRLRIEYGSNVVPLPKLVIEAIALKTPLITGIVTQPLPPTSETGATFPVSFEFVNNGNGTVNNVVLVPPSYPPGFTPGPNNCPVVPTPFPPGASCTISGSFTAATAGTYTISDTLTYFGGSTTVSTSTVATVQVTGALTTPLPNPIATTAQAPIVVTFTNNGTSTVSGVSAMMTVTTGTGFFVAPGTTTTCVGTLGPNQSCTISGTFRDNSPGTDIVTATLTYAGGTVTVTDTTLSQITVTGAVNPPNLPSTVSTGASYPITFTFTNNGGQTVNGNPDFSDSVMVNPPANGTFTVTSDTCTTPTRTSLASTASCSISGNLVPTASGQISVTATLSYSGNNVSVTTNTGTASQQVTGTATGLAQPNFEAGAQYTITFTFKNNDPVNAAGGPFAQTVSVSPNDGSATITPMVDNCTRTGSLPAGGTCVVSVIFQANATGPYIVTDTLTYSGGTVAPFINSTSQTQVTAVVTQGLQTPTYGTGSIYPITFTFTNPNTTQTVYGLMAPTTTVSGVGAFTSGPTSNCGTTLAPTQSCTVTGDFESNTTGSTTITSTLTYGNPPTHSLTATTNTTSTAADMVAASVVQGFPNPTIATGEDYTLTFQFTNSANEAATDVSITTSATGGGTYEVTSNNCDSSIPANNFCTISGTFSTAVTGMQTVTATVDWGTGRSSSASTTANAQVEVVTGQTTMNFPAGTLGTGSSYPLTFTFTNGAPVPATSVSVNAATSMGVGVFTQSGNTCGTSIPALSSCTFSGNYQTDSATAHNQVTATLTYADGTATATTTDNPSMVEVSGTSPGFPGPTVPSMGSSLTFTFTNGAGAAYPANGPITFTVATTPGDATWTAVGGTCTTDTSIATSCTYTGTFTTGATPIVLNSISVTLNYAGGSTAPVIDATVPAFAKHQVFGTVTTPLPPTTSTGKPGTPFKFTLKNGTTKKVENITVPMLTVKPASGLYTLDNTATSCGTAIKTLEANASCNVSGNFIAPTTGEYELAAVFNYEGKTIALSTKTNAGRLFTINNNCQEDVWFSFNGAAVKERCVKDSDCPTGSLCASQANSGRGICYYANPMPANKALKLVKDASAKVIVPDTSKTKTLWSGTFAGRTGCEGTLCSTADCSSGSGDKVCPPGNSFAQPATQTRFTLVRDAEDTYNIETMNGVNLGLSMGPSTEVKSSGKPNFCGTPGTTAKRNGLNACTWRFIPPSVDYVWVKAAKGKPIVCTSDAHCSATGEVCGLSYNAEQKPTFQRVCGPRLGYWTAKQACALNTTDADYYFGCNRLLSDNACVSVNGTKNSCYTDIATISALNAITWLKSGCPTATTYVNDTADSIFTCHTPVSGTNTTNYTITFCPA